MTKFSHQSCSLHTISRLCMQSVHQCFAHQSIIKAFLVKLLHYMVCIVNTLYYTQHIIIELFWWYIGIVLEPESQTKATGQTIELTCNVNGTSTDILTYQWIIRWYLDPVVVNGSNVLTIPNATVNNSAVYYCAVFITGNINTRVQSNSAIVTILRKLYF